MGVLAEGVHLFCTVGCNKKTCETHTYTHTHIRAFLFYFASLVGTILECLLSLSALSPPTLTVSNTPLVSLKNTCHVVAALHAWDSARNEVLHTWPTCPVAPPRNAFNSLAPTCIYIPEMQNLMYFLKRQKRRKKRKLLTSRTWW